MLSHLFNKSTGDEQLDKYISKYPGVDVTTLTAMIEQERQLTELLNDKRVLLEKKNALEVESVERINDGFFRRYLESVAFSPAGWYEDIGADFKGTVYENYRKEIEYIAQGNLSEKYLESMRKMVLHFNSAEKTEKVLNPYMVLHCDSVIQTAKGVCLILSDPCGTITTAPIENVTYDLVTSWIGLVLICKVTFNLERSGKITYSVSCVRTFARTIERK